VNRLIFPEKGKKSHLRYKNFLKYSGCAGAVQDWQDVQDWQVADHRELQNGKIIYAFKGNNQMRVH